MKNPYSQIVHHLAEASRAAAALGIDLSRPGIQRELVIAAHFDHELRRGCPPQDAVARSGETYAYAASHSGKRAQLHVSPTLENMEPSKRLKIVDFFIFAFFSAYDSARLVAAWKCPAEVVWREVDAQAAHRRERASQRPSNGTVTPRSAQIAVFSEAHLRALSLEPVVGRGPRRSELIFSADGGGPPNP